MTSRTISPLTREQLVAGRGARRLAAGEPGATATTRAVGIPPVYGVEQPATGRGPRVPSIAMPVGEGPARRAPWVLRRRRDGDQGPRLDGASVRAARLLLPRDRAQPARRRPVPRAGRRLRRRRRRRARRRAAHAVGPRLGARSGRRGPRPRPLRGQRGVPARHQGAPRGQGACRQGLHGPLRRPRGPRRGGRHARRRARRRSGSSSTNTTSTPCSPTVDDPSKVALLAQTTLSMHDWEGIMDRARDQFPDLWTAARNDLCFATTNRQAALHGDRRAGRRHRRDRQRRTRRTRSPSPRWRAPPAVQRCCASTGPTSSMPLRWVTPRVVGVTAGASAPEDLVQAVIARLAPSHGVEPVHVTDEDEYFPPRASSAS